MRTLKVHFIANGRIPCNQSTSFLRQSNKPGNVTCLKCRRAMGKGLQTELKLKTNGGDF